MQRNDQMSKVKEVATMQPDAWIGPPTEGDITLVMPWF
jgi:hypothetical protein